MCIKNKIITGYWLLFETIEKKEPFPVEARYLFDRIATKKLTCSLKKS